jgi:hypothetical protein
MQDNRSFVVMGDCFSFPRHSNGLRGKTIEASDSVDPSFHSYGSGILSLLIYYIYQQASTTVALMLTLRRFLLRATSFALRSPLFAIGRASNQQPMIPIFIFG